MASQLKREGHWGEINRVPPAYPVKERPVPSAMAVVSRLGSRPDGLVGSMQTTTVIFQYYHPACAKLLRLFPSSAPKVDLDITMAPLAHSLEGAGADEFVHQAMQG